MRGAQVSGEWPGQSPGQPDPQLGSGRRPACWVTCDVPGLPSGTDLRFSADTALAFPNFPSQTKISVTCPYANYSGSDL